ncbi:MAG: putative zinc transporter msc2 [Vezdaea aestivalis]|nr:MAG: putative zinc transporter msc2 [Vezdaea aestivalis]
MESSYALPLGPAGVHAHHHHHTLSSDRGLPKYGGNGILRKEAPISPLTSSQLNSDEFSHIHDHHDHHNSEGSHDHGHDHYKSTSSQFQEKSHHRRDQSTSTVATFHSFDKMMASDGSLDGAVTAYPQNGSYGIPSVGRTTVPGASQNYIEGKHSKLTRVLLRQFGHYPLAYTILSERDSRRIFYFTILNFSFMLVQTFYGIATGSLGLLSDSIHMLFDCLALVVGLSAAVMSKWPPSMRFPYGLGKMDTLAGFANGIFLMLISIEIVTEAIQRLAQGNEMHRIGELFIVSFLGLCVNAVGIFAFDHAHHGHGHSHDHSHGDHSHSPSQSHDHPHDHSHQEPCSHAHPHTPHNPSPLSPLNPSSSNSITPTASHHSHSHSHPHHHNENMQGIYLHIMADLMGSAAVTLSSILVYFYKWSGFDPLASCLIAILIFMSAIPLVKSSAKTLLLTLPADTEYLLRESLLGVSELRGVVGYTVPRFWLEDQSLTSNRKEEMTSKGGEISGAPEPGVLGVIHVIAARSSDIQDVYQRTSAFLRSRGLNVVVQVEKEGEGRCWCGGGLKSS